MSQHIPATLLPAASFNSLTNLARKDGIYCTEHSQYNADFKYDTTTISLYEPA